VEGRLASVCKPQARETLQHGVNTLYNLGTRQRRPWAAARSCEESQVIARLRTVHVNRVRAAKDRRIAIGSHQYHHHHLPFDNGHPG
jgi:hypothetical protein